MHNESDSSKGGIQASSSSETPELFLKYIMSSATETDMSLLRLTLSNKETLHDLGVSSIMLRDNSTDGFSLLLLVSLWVDFGS